MVNQSMKIGCQVTSEMQYIEFMAVYSFIKLISWFDFIIL